jgi:hypothetical protein
MRFSQSVKMRKNAATYDIPTSVEPAYKRWTSSARMNTSTLTDTYEFLGLTKTELSLA